MMEVGGFFFDFEAVRCSAQVPYEEDGAGQGGYAKEMSDEYKQAEQAMLTDEVAKADVVITTASDSVLKMNLNLTWSRRWRRCDATPPRRRRCGRMRVYVSRESVAVASRRRRSHRL